MSNSPNPLIPQGSLQQAAAKSNFRLAFFIVAAVHVVFLGGILMLGCKREEKEPDPAQQQNTLSQLPPLDSTYYPPIDTKAPASNPPTSGGPLDGPLGGPITNGSQPKAPGAGMSGLPTTSSLPPTGGDPLGLGATTATGIEPPPAPMGQEYSIARGDTLSGIAPKFGVSVKALLDANPGINPSRLQIGQVIRIPVAASSGPGVSAAAPAASAGPTDAYVVKSGDNLTRIARKFGTTVGALKSANGLRTDRINVGQKLKVPGAAAAATAPEDNFIPLDPATNGGFSPLPDAPRG
jgi:LysM repeat protein